MNINLTTKYNVGDIVNRGIFGGYLPIKILGIEIHVNKKNEIETYYLFKPYSDRPDVDIIREDQVFPREEEESEAIKWAF